MSSPDSTAPGDAAGLNPDTRKSLREGGSFEKTQTIYVKRTADGFTFQFGMYFLSGRVDDIFFQLGHVHVPSMGGPPAAAPVSLHLSVPWPWRPGPA